MNADYHIRISLDLQFFGAEDEGRTEKATGKKRADVRKKGQVAKSMEINTAFLFLFSFSSLKFLGTHMHHSLQKTFVESFQKISDMETFFEPVYMRKYIPYVFWQIIKISGPLLIIIMCTGLLSSYIQVGWHPTLETLQPKFSKLNPINGFKRMFSKEVFVELIKALFKVIVLGLVIYKRIKIELPTFLSLIDMSLMQIINYVGDLVVSIGLRIAIIFLFMSIADFMYQKYKFEDSIKMTKEEIKEEYKQSEGDPQIRSKIKQKMREMSMRRMMQSIPDADVIITNPTHYAVAIQYDPDKGVAPMVVAKGADYIAHKIKEKAKEHHIEIIENKPLARTLYATVEVGDEIPPELYQAVAEVLAFIYSLKKV